MPTTMEAVAMVICGCMSLAAAQVPGFGSCPTEVQAQSSLDIARYLGVWYEAYKFPDIFELGQRCVSANYTLKDNGHIRVDNIGYTNGAPKEVIGDAYRPDDSKPGQLAVRFADSTPYGAYWVIETDYDNYSLVYSCGRLLGFAHVESAWILSRQPQLAPAIADRLMNLLRDGGVNVDPFSKTDQSNCPQGLQGSPDSQSDNVLAAIG